MQNIINIVLILAVVYVIYRLPSVEKMTNIDKATEDKIREIYKIDTDAIRNLSNLAKDLTVGGTLTVPGGLKIKGSVDIDNGLKVKGFTEQLGGGSVEGKLYYRHQGANGSDDTDPYFIEKVRTSANNNHLRLTINDDGNESFQIWGNSCGSEGGCGGAGRELFNFSANGNITTYGNLTAKGITVTSVNLGDGNTSLIKGDSNSLRIKTNSGWVDIGSQNTGWTHIYTDRPKFAFNKPLTDVARAPYNDYIKSNDVMKIRSGAGGHREGWWVHTHNNGYMGPPNYGPCGANMIGCATQYTFVKQ
jgi:hypothetical protein